MEGKKLTRRAFLSRVAALAGIAAVGSLAAACGPTPAPKATEKVEKPATKVAEVVLAPSTKTPVTVRYMTYSGRALPDMENMSRSFESRFPYVTIKIENPPSGEYDQKFKTTVVAGTAADCFCGGLFYAPKYYKDFHFDFTERLKADGIDIKKSHSLMGIEIWAGRVMGLPWDFDTNAVFYNKDLVKKYYGKDLWDDMGGKWDLKDWEEILIACTQDTNKDGKIDIWGADGHMPNAEVWNQSFSHTRGGTVFDYQNMKYTWTSPIAMDNQKWGYDLWMKHKVFVPPDELSALTKAGIPSAFAGGLAAVRYRAVADVGRFITQVADKFKWDCILLPGKTKDKPGVHLATGNLHLGNRLTKVPDEMYEYLKFMMGEEVQSYFGKKQIFVPTLRSVQHIYVENAVTKHAGLFAEVTKYDYHIHIIHFNAGECNGTIVPKYMEQIYLGGAALEPTITKMNDELNSRVEYGDNLPWKGIQIPFPGSGV